MDVNTDVPESVRMTKKGGTVHGGKQGVKLTTEVKGSALTDIYCPQRWTVVFTQMDERFRDDILLFSGQKRVGLN